MHKKALLLTLLAMFWGVFLFAQKQQTTVVYFALDSEQLNKDSKETLDQLFREIETLDRWELEIRAHTDAIGTNAYNDGLAKKRAESVRNYLIGWGLSSDLIRISSFGEYRPAETNSTETGRSRNRRVEITLQSWELEHLQDLISGLQDNEMQHFTFPAGQNVAITGAAGTTLWIPARIFIHADGSLATGNIDLEMREAYDYNDMISLGLSTHSGQKMLETGGMVYLRARSNGEDLQIRAGEEMVMAQPTDIQKGGMQLFTGNTDADGNLTDWAPTGQPSSDDRLAVLRIADPPPMPKIKTELTFFKYDKSGEPTMPSKPREPVYPRKPKRESIKYNPGFVKRLFTGKKKILEKEEAIYAHKMAQYEARVEKYPELMEAYQAEIAAYEIALKAYKTARAAWEAGLEEQWNDHIEARNKKYEAAIAEAEGKYRRTLEAYEEYKARKIAEYETAVEMGHMDQRSLNNYFFAVNRLGWINCDRFYETADSDKEPLWILDNDEQEELVFVIFKNIRSALRTTRQEDGYYRTQSVPRGAEARVVGLKVQDGRSLLAVKEITVGETEAIDLEYEPRRLSEIRQTLADLD